MNTEEIKKNFSEAKEKMIMEKIAKDPDLLRCQKLAKAVFWLLWIAGVARHHQAFKDSNPPLSYARLRSTEVNPLERSAYSLKELEDDIVPKIIDFTKKRLLANIELSNNYDILYSLVLKLKASIDYDILNPLQNL